MPRRVRLLAVMLAVSVAVLAGCQMQVAVDVQVQPDGSGTVTVGVGLDDDALGRIGDLDAQVRVDDLRAAGWQVSAAHKEDDGLTWVRASKGFAEPAQAAGVLAEVTGPDGAFRDFAVTKRSSLTGTTYRVTGTVDLTGGPAAFSDAELTQALGGDPFGGTLAAIEQEEGRPVSDMVDFRLTVDLPGAAPKVYTPSFADQQPTQVSVSATHASWFANLWIWALVLLGAGVALVVLRQAFRRARS